MLVHAVALHREPLEEPRPRGAHAQDAAAPRAPVVQGDAPVQGFRVGGSQVDVREAATRRRASRRASLRAHATTCFTAPAAPAAPADTVARALESEDPTLPSSSRRKKGDSGFSRRTSTDRTSPNGAKRARSSSSRSSRGRPPTCSRECAAAPTLTPSRPRLTHSTAAAAFCLSRFGPLHFRETFYRHPVMNVASEPGARCFARWSSRSRPAPAEPPPPPVPRTLTTTTTTTRGSSRGARAGGWWCGAGDDGLGTIWRQVRNLREALHAEPLLLQTLAGVAVGLAVGAIARLFDPRLEP